MVFEFYSHGPYFTTYTSINMYMGLFTKIPLYVLHVIYCEMQKTFICRYWIYVADSENSASNLILLDRAIRNGCWNYTKKDEHYCQFAVRQSGKIVSGMKMRTGILRW